MIENKIIKYSFFLGVLLTLQSCSYSFFPEEIKQEQSHQFQNDAEEHSSQKREEKVKNSDPLDELPTETAEIAKSIDSLWGEEEELIITEIRFLKKTPAVAIDTFQYPPQADIPQTGGASSKTFYQQRAKNLLNESNKTPEKKTLSQAEEIAARINEKGGKIMKEAQLSGELRKLSNSASNIIILKQLKELTPQYLNADIDKKIADILQKQRERSR